MFLKTFQLLLIAVLMATAAFAEQWSKSFAVSGKPELQVDAEDSAVTVRVWDRKQIEARVTTVGWNIGHGDVQVIDHQTGDRVELELHLPRQTGIFGRRSVRLDLMVPADVRSDIRTGDGNISVDSLHGETRLATGDGRIDANSLDGTLDASSGDGRMHVQGRFDQLTLRSGDGSVDAEVGNGSRVASEWRVRSGDGRVTLRLPASFSADLDVRSDGRHIESDFAGIAPGNRPDRDLRGRLNAGGGLVTVRTGDGAIRIERQ